MPADLTPDELAAIRHALRVLRAGSWIDQLAAADLATLLKRLTSTDDAR